MFVKDGNLTSHEEIFDALLTYDYRGCECSPKFLEIASNYKDTDSEFSEAILIAAKLTEDFDRIESKQDGKYHRLYGHDAKGEKHLLIERDY